VAGNGLRMVRSPEACVVAAFKRVPVVSCRAGRGTRLALRLAGGRRGTPLLGFGLPSADFVPSERRHVQRALHTIYPDATMLEFHHHDWVEDRWARGTYVSTPAGETGMFASTAWATSGSLHFAGSDLAPDHVCWFEGALLSGRDIAAVIVATARVRRVQT